jgi:hypothetical protein
VILFTAASGGISASACARIVTNRYDVLLQSVIGALEELRGNLEANHPRCDAGRIVMVVCAMCSAPFGVPRVSE